MSRISESDLAEARTAVEKLLEAMGFAARLFAVEAREGNWVVIVECATETGWQRAELQAGSELLASGRGDPEARAAIVAQWRPHLSACKPG